MRDVMADGGNVAGTALWSETLPLVPHAALNTGPLSVRPLTRQRTKLWELSDSFHCSVIGTCLSTAELRKTVGRALRRDVSGLSDHDLHSRAVGMCSQRGDCAKALQRVLDQRHQSAIGRFAKLRGEDAVMAQWAEARRAGDIPGAYWAVLTHPDVGPAGMRHAFGDVHMLSHLMGAANRADIRRLAALEAENARLAAKVERQQQRLQEAIETREATIRRLGTLAAGQVRAELDVDDALAGLRALVADLQARLCAETGRRERLERRFAEANEAREAWRRRAAAAEAESASLGRELAFLEPCEEGDAARVHARLPARRVLYVGGRPSCVEHARALLAAAGGELLCHDGGRDDHPSLLPGLIARADHVVFPVTCVSHDAALAVKRVCRQLGKPWSPLRSGGVASFIAAVSERHGP